MQRGGHVESDVILASRRLERQVAIGIGLLRRVLADEIAESRATPLVDAAPTLDAFELGNHLDLGERFNLVERQSERLVRAGDSRNAQFPILVDRVFKTDVAILAEGF